MWVLTTWLARKLKILLILSLRELFYNKVYNVDLSNQNISQKCPDCLKILYPDRNRPE